jgi:hypothetical protein
MENLTSSLWLALFISQKWSFFIKKYYKEQKKERNLLLFVYDSIKNSECHSPNNLDDIDKIQVVPVFLAAYLQ